MPYATKTGVIKKISYFNHSPAQECSACIAIETKPGVQEFLTFKAKVSDPIPRQIMVSTMLNALTDAYFAEKVIRAEYDCNSGLVEEITISN